MKARDIRENGIRIDVKRGFQITQQHGTMCIVHDGHRYDVDGYDMYMVEKQEPWPAIGSLDWAIQRMRDGEKIFRPDWADKTARISMVVEDKITWESDALGITIMDMRKWDSRILGEYRNSGWQIYEPKPHYQVGDWVEVCSDENVYPCEVVKVGKDSISIDFAGNYRTVPTDNSVSMTGIKLIRKISPHEVVLDFGNGIKGTIGLTPLQMPEDVLIYVKNGNGINCARIFVSCLTEPMKTTVLELLKAQSEEA